MTSLIERIKAANAIPVMDDPLGRHWRQPADIRFVVMDDSHVLLTPNHLAQLPEYSSTIPSGVYPGKCWQRKEPERHLLAWYGDETPDGMCGIMFREILVVEDAHRARGVE